MLRLALRAVRFYRQPIMDKYLVKNESSRTSSADGDQQKASIAKGANDRIGDTMQTQQSACGDAGAAANQPASSAMSTRVSSGQKLASPNAGFKYTEKKGDLFSCGPSDSLAHCISEDARMGKGIAVLFKKKFGGVKEILCQEQKSGGVAVLVRESRFIYYLITKPKYHHKPTYDSLRASLEAMKAHCVAHQVTSVAMPKIGCGLDGLQWDRVAPMIRDIFSDINISITVYYL